MGVERGGARGEPVAHHAHHPCNVPTATLASCSQVRVHQHLIVACKGEALNSARARAFGIDPGAVEGVETEAPSKRAAPDTSALTSRKVAKAGPSSHVDEVPAQTCFEVPQSALDAFAGLSQAERLSLFERVLAATDGPDALRPVVRHQRTVLTAAGIAFPAAFGRCLDVSRAWSVLDPSVALCREWRAAPDAVRACAASGCKQCEPELFHAFLKTGKKRIDPTASQLHLYGSPEREEAAAVEPTGQARSASVRIGDGREQRICKADLVTLRAAVELLAHNSAASIITDAGAITPIHVCGDAFVKRDDLFDCNGATGSKTRSVLRMAQDAKRRKRRDARGLVVAASRNSTMLGRIARVSARLEPATPLASAQGSLPC